MDFDFESADFKDPAPIADVSVCLVLVKTNSPHFVMAASEQRERAKFGLYQKKLAPFWFDKKRWSGYTKRGGTMTPQDTYATFAQEFSGMTGKLSLREWDGTIHAYPMRDFKRKRVVIIPGTPLCGDDVRYIQARALPTADAPNCEKCLAQMRRALGRE